MHPPVNPFAISTLINRTEPAAFFAASRQISEDHLR
jgi:hypothetical protein